MESVCGVLPTFDKDVRDLPITALQSERCKEIHQNWDPRVTLVPCLANYAMPGLSSPSNLLNKLDVLPAQSHIK